MHMFINMKLNKMKFAYNMYIFFSTTKYTNTRNIYIKKRTYHILSAI